MSFLEHKIPPPIIGILSAGMMWVIAYYSFQINPPPMLANSIAGFFLVIGLLLDTGGLIAFIRKKTKINPLKIETASSLVTRGIYRITRNPMYLGMAFLLTGFGVWLSTPLAFVGVAFFVGYITRFQIIPEERALNGLFGEEYRQYCQRVRRWL
jgi:protein-S-isoprenylcysteine O-methyltransferase Ste14